MMKEIEFSSSQFQFLMDNFPSLSAIFEKSTVSFQSYIVSLENSQIEHLLDGLSSLLLEQGIQIDSEPNDLGYFIESLIDPLSRAFYSSDVR
ncbi:hypothetical protein ACN9ML_24065 [Dyadobacter endophyticus]|uniref:hypothetical protein n=1 Tax=Dyadobacter TaxID=120831 RepID=UPI003CE78DA7